MKRHEHSLETGSEAKLLDRQGKRGKGEEMLWPGEEQAPEPSVVAQVCQVRHQEGEAGGSRVQRQPGLQDSTLSKDNKNQTNRRLWARHSGILETKMTKAGQ